MLNVYLSYDKFRPRLTPLKTKFLLADDDADDAGVFCEALAQIAPVMECLTVEHGRKLFNLLSEEKGRKPDVIFLDINMPIMNGWECLKKLKNDSNYRDIPAIMYSTSSSKKDIDKAYKLGALLFLTKPESFRQLCQILEIVATNPNDSLFARLRGFECLKGTNV